MRTAKVDEILGVLRTRPRNSDVAGGPMRTSRVDEILGVLQMRQRNFDVVVGPMRTVKVDDQVWWQMQNPGLQAFDPRNWRHVEMLVGI